MREALRYIFSEIVFRTHFLLNHYENAERERFLERNNFFDNKGIILFGDSQVACWRMYKYFGCFPIRNRGKNGDRADTALGRIEEDVLKFSPKSVFLLLGTNDIAQRRKIEDIAEDISKIVAAFQKNGIESVVCSILPVRGIYKNKRPLEELRKINKLISNITDRHKLDYIDFWPALADDNGDFKADLTYDGLHPNLKGYSIMADLLLSKILDILR